MRSRASSRLSSPPPTARSRSDQYPTAPGSRGLASPGLRVSLRWVGQLIGYICPVSDHPCDVGPERAADAGGSGPRVAMSRPPPLLRRSHGGTGPALFSWAGLWHLGNTPRCMGPSVHGARPWGALRSPDQRQRSARWTCSTSSPGRTSASCRNRHLNSTVRAGPGTSRSSSARAPTGSRKGAWLVGGSRWTTARCWYGPHRFAHDDVRPPGPGHEADAGDASARTTPSGCRSCGGC